MISIIIPIYNGEKYLHRCVESILVQSYCDYELILINDGSTDSSLDICNDYAQKDDRIVVISQTNSGVSVARNRGLKEAKGEYISFVDCDDWIDCDYLQSLHREMIDNDVDFVVNGYREVCEDGVIGKDTTALEYSEIADNHQMLMHLFEPVDFFSFCYPWGKLYKKSIISEFDIRFDKNIAIGEDRLFIYEYLVNSKCRSFVSSKSSYNYILNSQGAMSLVSLPVIPMKYLSNFEALSIMRSDMTRRNLKPIVKVLNTDYARSLIRMIRLMLNKNQKDNKLFINRLRTYIRYYLFHPLTINYRLWIKLVLNTIRLY